VFARASFQGTYSVITDYELQPGDCRLEWDGGGAERSEARIWRDIREIVAANFGGMDADAMDQAADQVHEDQTQAPAEAGHETPQ
jgi:hypothetical protein